MSQALFARLLKTGSPWLAERGPLGGWLSVIISRLVLDGVRSSSRNSQRCEDDEERAPGREFADPDNGNRPYDQTARREQADRLHRAVEELPFEVRQIVTLRYIGGHTLQEIAQELGLPLTTVHRRLQHGLDLLRDAVVELDPTAGLGGAA